MNVAAGRPSHWVTRMARSMSGYRAVRRLVNRLGVQPTSSASAAQVRSRSWRRASRAACSCGRSSGAGYRYCLGQPRISDSGHRAGQEVLRWPGQPAQHEQRVLVRDRLVLRKSPDGPAAQRVICGPLRVELGRLLPQLRGEGKPAQPAVAAVVAERRGQRIAVEDGQPGRSREQVHGWTRDRITDDRRPDPPRRVRHCAPQRRGAT